MGTSLFSTKTTKYVPLPRSGKDRQHPEDGAFPYVQNAKSPCVRLERLARQRGDSLDVTGKRLVGQPRQVLNEPVTFLATNLVKVPLRPTNQPQVVRKFACHGRNR